MTHKIFWTNPAGTNTRTEFYDDIQGKCIAPWNEPIRSPFQMGYNGLLGEEAFMELMKPNWNGKPFGEALPYVAKVPAQYLTVSNYKPYPQVTPTEDVLYNTRRSYAPGRYVNFTPCTYNQVWWTIMGVQEWKLVTEAETRKEPNPEYPVYLQKRADFKLLLQQTLVPYGNYQFPGLPLIPGYKWFIDDIEIPQDVNHPLANADGGWKMLMKPLPSSMWNAKYEGAMNYSIMLGSPYNVRKLLGI